MEDIRFNVRLGRVNDRLAVLPKNDGKQHGKQNAKSYVFVFSRSEAYLCEASKNQRVSSELTCFQAH
jgi:hypothetical protein